jgi:hypothetical protein
MAIQLTLALAIVPFILAVQIFVPPKVESVW